MGSSEPPRPDTFCTGEPPTFEQLLPDCCNLQVDAHAGMLEHSKILKHAGQLGCLTICPFVHM